MQAPRAHAASLGLTCHRGWASSPSVVVSLRPEALPPDGHHSVARGRRHRLRRVNASPMSWRDRQALQLPVSSGRWADQVPWMGLPQRSDPDDLVRILAVRGQETQTLVLAPAVSTAAVSGGAMPHPVRSLMPPTGFGRRERMAALHPVVLASVLRSLGVPSRETAAG